MNWDVSALVTTLRERIPTLTSGSAFAELATERYRSFLTSLSDEVGGRYEQPEDILLGPNTVILKCNDRSLAGRAKSIKFLRLEGPDAPVLHHMLDTELRHLSAIQHPNVVRLESYGKVTLDREPPPPDGGPHLYIVTDWIEGRPSHEAVERMDEQELITLVIDTVAGIAHLHSLSIAHLDIKPDNIIVKSAGELPGTAVLVDLGSAKVTHQSDPSETALALTQEYADPQLLAFLNETSPAGTNTPFTISRDQIRLSWDFFPLGRTLLDWLGVEYYTGKWQNAIVDSLSAYTVKYIYLMAARLLGSEHAPSWLLENVSLNRTQLSSCEYVDASQVWLDAQKLTGDYSVINRVPELNRSAPETLQIGTSEPLTLTSRLRKLLGTRALRRLASITQLGFANQVYPTATHTRLEHTLGTFQNTARILTALYEDDVNPLFKQLSTVEDMEAGLLAALLHDVGQYPLAHDLEELDRRLFKHERLTMRILGQAQRDGPEGEQVEESLYRDLATAIPEDWSVSISRVRGVLSSDTTSDRFPVMDRILHSIIDGPLDADKLDYLSRDSINLGIPYGSALETERIVRSATVAINPHETSSNRYACLAVSEKGRAAAEFVSVVRSTVYSQVYWHHAVRACKAMLGRAYLELAAALGRWNANRRAHFQRQFEEFVLALPDAMHARRPVQEVLFGQAVDKDEGWYGSRTTIAATDVAVLLFLRDAITGATQERFGTEEGRWRPRTQGSRKLIEDLLNRELYKRLFVYSLGPQVNEIAQRWLRLSADRKLLAYRDFEEQLVARVRKAAGAPEGPPTQALSPEVLDELKALVGAGTPLLLVDVPPSKPGSSVPLLYVQETPRRQRRDDPGSLGRIKESDVWREHSGNLPATVGKLRFFMHPEIVKAVGAAIDDEEFLAEWRDSIARHEEA